MTILRPLRSGTQNRGRCQAGIRPRKKNGGRRNPSSAACSTWARIYLFFLAGAFFFAAFLAGAFFFAAFLAGAFFFAAFLAGAFFFAVANSLTSFRVLSETTSFVTAKRTPCVLLTLLELFFQSLFLHDAFARSSSPERAQAFPSCQPEREGWLGVDRVYSQQCREAENSVTTFSFWRELSFLQPSWRELFSSQPFWPALSFSRPSWRVLSSLRPSWPAPSSLLLPKVSPPSSVAAMSIDYAFVHRLTCVRKGSRYPDAFTIFSVDSTCSKVFGPTFRKRGSRLREVAIDVTGVFPLI